MMALAEKKTHAIPDADVTLGAFHGPPNVLILTAASRFIALFISGEVVTAVSSRGIRAVHGLVLLLLVAWAARSYEVACPSLPLVCATSSSWNNIEVATDPDCAATIRICRLMKRLCSLPSGNSP